MTKTLLTFDDIKDLVDREHVDHPVPAWGGTVRLAVMSGEDRDAWDLQMVSWDEQGNAKFKPAENMRADLVARCWVDENYQRVVTKKQVVLLGQKSGIVLDELYDICKKLNKITDDEIDELEKN